MDLVIKNCCFTNQKLEAKRTTSLGWNLVIIPVKALILADERNILDMKHKIHAASERPIARIFK